MTWPVSVEEEVDFGGRGRRRRTPATLWIGMLALLLLLALAAGGGGGLSGALGWIVQEGSLLFRRFQTGLVQNYALLMLFGIFAFVSIYLFVR